MKDRSSSSPESDVLVAPVLATSGFFALRTPLLPYHSISQISADLRAPRALAEGGDLARALDEDRASVVERLRSVARDPVVREAIFLASPSLDEAVTAWIGQADHARAQGVAEIVLRYLARMATRPTPFGLFSGCSVGVLGARNRLELGERSECRRHTRLDMRYLVPLCERLNTDPALREVLVFRPSTSLYPRSSTHLAYVEEHFDSETQRDGTDIVTIERTEFLDSMLLRAQDGARRGDLVAALVEQNPQIEVDAAAAYVDSLIDSQILVSDLAPLVCGEEPLGEIVRTLEAHPPGEPFARALRHAGEAIAGLDAEPLGIATSRYRTLAEDLGALPQKVDTSRLFHVDMIKPTASCELSTNAVREIEAGVVLLARLTPNPTNAALERFCDAFTKRYGASGDGPLAERRSVSLAEVLDPEVGIGFDAAAESAGEPLPLLQGLVLGSGRVEPRVSSSSRDTHLLRAVLQAQRDGKREWTLSARDIDALSSRTPVALPSAFAVVGWFGASSGAAFEAGDFRFALRSFNGPSGAAQLGRFLHGDPALLRAVEQHIRDEEGLRPDAIFAEVAHLPAGAGNLVCRPALRTHEISYLGRGTRQKDHSLPISDLRVTVSCGRVALFSAELGREVLPRMTCAHNYAVGSLPIYRFLGALQHQRDGLGVVRWDWGTVAGAPFLPRVTAGRIVLSLARWALDKSQLATLASARSRADQYRAVQSLRSALDLPRWVAFEERDNVLPIDLDNVLHVESFVQLVKAREGATLVEIFPGEEDLVAHGSEGKFAHEIVLPFIRRDGAELPQVGREPARARPSNVVRTFTPGSEWLCTKLYAGVGTSDAVLRGVLLPTLESVRDSLRSWFFLRAADPEPHVRICFHGDPRALLENVLPRLNEATAPFIDDLRIWRMQVDTYERAIEPFGGEHGIALAEAIFGIDSDATLSIIDLLDDADAVDARWRLTLLGLHTLLLDFGFDLARRTALVQKSCDSLRAELGVDVAFDRSLGAKFRAERKSLDELMAAQVGGPHPLEPGIALFAERSISVSTVVEEIRDRAKRGLLTVRIDDVARGILRTHANRLLDARKTDAQELVLYEILLRLYASEAARKAKGGA